MTEHILNTASTRTWAHQDTSGAQVITEYAVRMTSGDMLVRNGAPHVERIFPLADWVAAERGNSVKVWRRRVVVAEDWEEVTGP